MDNLWPDPTIFQREWSYEEATLDTNVVNVTKIDERILTTLFILNRSYAEILMHAKVHA